MKFENRMDIIQSLKKEHSRKMMLNIVDYIGDDPKRFSELISVFIDGNYRLTQRASWPMSYIVRQNPELIYPWLKDMITWLDKPFHISVKRNIIRILQDISIPEKYLGTIIEKCFTYLRNENEAIAVQAFSMQVVFNACLKYPELAYELKICIENLMPNASAGIKNRGSKILAKIEKMKFK